MKATVNQSAAEKNITLVSLADIQPSSFNPRKYFSEPALYELAESIKQQGVLQPITVRTSTALLRLVTLPVNDTFL